jgi:hypothetical protein
MATTSSGGGPEPADREIVRTAASSRVTHLTYTVGKR